jgi:chaperonin GroEL
MKTKQTPGVVFQPHVYRAMQRGIQKMTNAIRPTLGPLSGGVAIDPLNDAEHLPEYLDDGGLIARRIIQLANRDEDMGAMLMRSMITRQSDYLNDGTATLAVLFDAVFNSGLKYIAAGGNAAQIRRHLETALPIILTALDGMAFELRGQKALTQMARTLCHDDELAALLGDAFDMIGDFGRLDIREDYGRIMHREYVDGSYFHGGLMTRILHPEQVTGKVSIENAAIFLSDFEMNDHRDLFPVLQAAHSAKVKHLVILARNLSEAAISLLTANNRMDRFKIMAIRLPGMNPDDRMGVLQDLSVLTGARAYLQITGDTLTNFSAAHFGHVRRLWADDRMFGLFGGGGSPVQLRKHVANLKASYALIEEMEPRRDMQERIGSLMGGSVTIRIGGFTEPEINIRRNKAQRAALTLRTAVQEGVVPGGGIALLKCRGALEKARKKTTDFDERAAYGCLIEALAAPANAIYRNAGLDPGAVLVQLNPRQKHSGFDVVSKQVVDMGEAGIVDSLLILKHTVNNAVRTAALALTIDSFVHLSAPELIGKPT